LTVDYLGGLQGASHIDAEQNHFMRRQRSDLSDSFKISCSPEAESYFRRKAESLYDRACRGELEVEVRRSDVAREEGLRVLPIFRSNEAGEDEEVEVTDLSTAPALEVKPIPEVRTACWRSSYESLYDSARLDDVVSSEASAAVPASGMVFGDKFTGTYDQPKAASSFEKLYSETPGDPLPEDWSRDPVFPERSGEPGSRGDASGNRKLTCVAVNRV
jgi:hypothetical protein